MMDIDLFTIDGAVEYFTNHPDAVTPDNYFQTAARVGRNNEPALLHDLYWSKLIPDGLLPAVVSSAWTAAEYPRRLLSASMWVHLFREAGFTVDGKPAAAPSEPWTLYRGATTKHKCMAWTTSLEIAETFAYGGLRGRRRGRVYTATVQPEHVLAVIGEREEHEVVVDPAGLVNMQVFDSRRVQ